MAEGQSNPGYGLKQYLTCPYQFYLRHVEALEEPDDRVIEMDCGLFGSLAHHVLAEFARSDLRNSVETGEIERFAVEELGKRVIGLFGRNPEPAVLLQRDQLAQRLRYFAREQADRAVQGWRILPEFSELREPVQALLDSGRGIYIKGRIDRIERHNRSQRIAIVDYKTSDSAKTPEEAHQEKKGGVQRWTDLQLPLYQLLAAALGLEVDMLDLAYFNIPAEEGKVKIVLAKWQQPHLDEAHELAREIALKICMGQFPPAPPDGRRSGDFTGIRYVGARGWKTLAEAARRVAE